MCLLPDALAVCPLHPRKHVLLASVRPAPEGRPLEEWGVQYLTFAPDIQQSSNKERLHGALSAAPVVK